MKELSSLGGSKSKKTTVKPSLKTAGTTNRGRRDLRPLFAFLAAFVLYLISLIVFQKYPLGDDAFLISDLKAQYAPFLALMRSKIVELGSVPQDQLYNACITINPTPKATRFHVNYYQMVANSGSLVDTLGAVAGGYAAKLMESFSTAFLAAAANTKYVPSSRKATGYTTTNWATIARNVAAANRVRRDQLIAYGDFLSLRKVLPDNATLAPAIMTLLGDEYFKDGYLMSHDGVMLYELTPTSTPATINTTMTSPFPTDTIVIAARANLRYAPMVIGFEEGGEGRIDLTPGDNVIADGYIEGLSFASYEIVPAFTSAIGIIDTIV